MAALFWAVARPSKFFPVTKTKVGSFINGEGSAELRSPLSVHRMVRAVHVHTPACIVHVRACACRLVTGELPNALTPSFIFSSSQHISPFVFGELMFFFCDLKSLSLCFTTQWNECQEQKLHFIAETSGWWVDYPIKSQTFSGSSISKVMIFFFSLCCVIFIWICGYLTFDLTKK